MSQKVIRNESLENLKNNSNTNRRSSQDPQIQNFSAVAAANGSAAPMPPRQMQNGGQIVFQGESSNIQGQDRFETRQTLPGSQEIPKNFQKNFVISHKSSNNATQMTRSKLPQQNNFQTQKESNFSANRPSTTGALGFRNPYSIKKPNGGQQLKQEQDLFKQNFVAFDKEKIFEEMMNAKQLMNETKAENAVLKTKTQHLEKQIQKYEKIIEELHQGNRGAANQQNAKAGNDSYILVGLKKQVKELQDSAKKKDNELEQMKRNVKYTGFQELEIEKNHLGEETIRLRKIVDDMAAEANRRGNQDFQVNELQERCYKLKEIVDTVRADNTELVQSLKQLEEKAHHQGQESMNAGKEIKTLQRNLGISKKMVKDKDAEIVKLKEQLEEKKSNAVAAAIAAKQVVESNSSNKGGNKVPIPGVPSKPNNQSKLMQEKAKLQKELAEAHAKIKEQEAKLTEKSQKSHEIGNSNTPAGNIRPKSSSSEKKPEGEKRKRISFKQISEVAYQIRFRLFNKGLPYEHVHQVIVPEALHLKGKATYQEIIDILKSEPFCVTDPASLTNLSRFLVEADLETEDVVVDNNKTCDTNIIEEAFVSFIQQYDLLGIRQHIDLFQHEIFSILLKKGESIRKGLEQASHDGKHISFQDIDYVFQEQGITISFQAMDLIIAHLFEKAGDDLNALSIQDLFDFFFESKLAKDRTSTIEEKEHEESYDQDYDQFSEGNDKIKDEEEKEGLDSSKKKGKKNDKEDEEQVDKDHDNHHQKSSEKKQISPQVTHKADSRKESLMDTEKSIKKTMEESSQKVKNQLATKEEGNAANSKEGKQSSLNDNHETQKEPKVDKIKEKKKRDSEVVEENTNGKVNQKTQEIDKQKQKIQEINGITEASSDETVKTKIMKEQSKQSKVLEDSNVKRESLIDEGKGEQKESKGETKKIKSQEEKNQRANQEGENEEKLIKEKDRKRKPSERDNVGGQKVREQQDMVEQEYQEDGEFEDSQGDGKKNQGDRLKNNDQKTQKSKRGSEVVEINQNQKEGLDEKKRKQEEEELEKQAKKREAELQEEREQTASALKIQHSFKQKKRKQEGKLILQEQKMKKEQHIKEKGERQDKQQILERKEQRQEEINNEAEVVEEAEEQLQYEEEFDGEKDNLKNQGNQQEEHKVKVDGSKNIKEEEDIDYENDEEFDGNNGKVDKEIENNKEINQEGEQEEVEVEDEYKEDIDD